MAVPRVILYSHPGCPGSEAARAYFARHGVSYELRDVSRDPLARAEWRALGCLATPVVLVEDVMLIGFDPDRFRAAHDRAAAGAVQRPRGG